MTSLLLMFFSFSFSKDIKDRLATADLLSSFKPLVEIVIKVNNESDFVGPPSMMHVGVGGSHGLHHQFCLSSLLLNRPVLG